MARMTLTLNEIELQAACREYVARKYSVRVKSVHLDGTPGHDAMDRPTGTYDVSARVECEPAQPPTADGKD